MALIIANWKMNKTVEEAVQFVKELKTKQLNNDVVICPSFVCLYALKELGIDLGAQNISAEEDGAFTGETSAKMLKEVCKYVIIGHSERRAYYDEDDQLVNKKTKIALKYDLIPIVCCGETIEQKKKGLSKEIVEKQLKICLDGIDISKIIIAYEPVWAIGTGKTASPEQAQEMHAFIKEKHSTTVIYGGSVKPGNAKELMEQKDIDGGLIGGAALKVEDFLKVINYTHGQK